MFNKDYMGRFPKVMCHKRTGQWHICHNHDQYMSTFNNFIFERSSKDKLPSSVYQIDLSIMANNFKLHLYAPFELEGYLLQFIYLQK